MAKSSQLLLVSFCNVTVADAPLLAVVDSKSGDVQVVDAPRVLAISAGITGMAFCQGRLCVVSQGLRLGDDSTDARPSLFIFGDDLGVEEHYFFAHARDPHSLLVRGDSLLVASTGTDEIVELAIQGGRVASERVIWSMSDDGSDQNHLNAICPTRSGYALSGFGPRADESWASATSGFVKLFETGEDLITGLQQPHSLVAVGRQLAFCESRRAVVRLSDGSESAALGGYTRGLTKVGDQLFAGVSRGRLWSRSRDVVENPAEQGDPLGRCALYALSLDLTQAVEIADLSHLAQEIYDVSPVPPSMRLPLIEDGAASRAIAAKLWTSNDRASREMRESIGEADRLGSLISERDAELAALRAETADAHGHLEAQLEETRAESDRVRGALDQREREVEHLLGARQELETKIAGLTAKLEQLALERDGLRTGVSEYEQDRDRWQARAEEAEQGRTSLNERLEVALAAAATAEVQRDGWERATEELRTAAEQLETRLQAELEKLEAWLALAREREQERDYWRERAQSAEGERAGLNERLAVALATAAAAEAHREGWERTANEARVSAEQLKAHVQAELDRLAVERDALRARETDQEEERKRWQERAEGAEQERIRLNALLEEAAATRAEAEAQSRAWERATEEARGAAEQLERRLDAEIEQLTLERDTWRTSATEGDEDRARWRERAEGAALEREVLNERLAAARAAAAAAEAQREGWESAADELRTAAEQLETRLRAEAEELQTRLQAELEQVARERDALRTRATENEQDRDYWQERAGSEEQERARLKEQLEAALTAVAAAEAQRERVEGAIEEARTSARQLEARLRTEVEQLALEAENWRRGASEYEQDRDRWRQRAERAEEVQAGLNAELNAVVAAVEASRGLARQFRTMSQFGSWIVRGRLGYVRRFFALRRSFDREAYLALNRDVAASGLHPLLHYIEHGAREGRVPEPVPKEALEGPAVRLGNGEADIAEVAGDAHEREDGRDASAQPDPTAELSGDPQEPVNGVDLDELPRGVGAADATPPAPPNLPAAAEEVRRSVHPGPEFEEFDPQIVLGASPRVKAIAFYLPQFHAIPENDEWWGNGFTEWSNVARGYPRYVDHYQPRLPRDLGFYDLSRAETMARQINLARAAGIHGFSFYYYWFDGKRLLERPVERLLDDPAIDFPFCLTWANENWTRRWDGFDDELLIAQTYDPEYDVALVDDLQRHFADPRYIRLQSRPLFLLYRVDCIPDAARRIERWRDLWKSRHGEEPLIFVAQAFGSTDPRVFGLDGAFEFPPHKLVERVAPINSRLTILDPAFRGHVVAYEDVVAEALAEPTPEYPLIRTAVPSWDNDARRQGAGLTLQGSTPTTYGRWLSTLVDAATQQPVFGESLVLINAWNEWAEAAYLEPDAHYGAAYLNATARALRASRPAAKRKVLFVGHDAHRHGAQINVWHMGDTVKNQFGCEVAYLLLGDGAMVPEYEQLGRVWVADGDPARIAAAVAELRDDGFELAVTNTAVSGSVVPHLKAAGFRVVSLIHELPIILGELGGEESLAAIIEQADTIVVPAGIVAHAITSHASVDVRERMVVRPQGMYKQLEEPRDARAHLRRRLGIADESRIVLNIGFGDLRKGIDTFVHVAKLAALQTDDLHFVWLGNLHRDAERWLREDFGGSIRERLHFVPYDENVEEFYFGADAFFLSSREDPFPSVVLEAMSAGLPVVGFAGASGTEELIAEHGRLVDRDDLAGVVTALGETTHEGDERARMTRARVVAEQFKFDDYCFDLLRFLEPDLEKISVIIPNYNYARYIEGRMRSIFDQTYPVFETLVLDDCSTDGSLALLDDIARATGRRFHLVANDDNSGSPFAQWERGCRLVRGKYAWVAEADDDSDPRFLEEVVSPLRREGASFAFSDSVPIDQAGAKLAESYKSYYREAVGPLMDSSFVLDGTAFVEQCLTERNLVLNVSAVLWNRTALIDALSTCRDALQGYRLAGDWHLYSTAALLDGRVAYVAAPLNIHRRHHSSVTAALDGLRHVDEVERVQRFIAETLGVNGTTRHRMHAYVDGLRHQLGVVAQDAPATEEGSLVSVLEAAALGVARDWVESSYYADAEKAMDAFWDEGSPFRELFDELNLTAVAEVACGHGRHAEHIADWTGSLVVIDIHASNVDFCRARLAGRENVRFVVNNGYDLQPLADGSLTSIFCYDAMVHFPCDVIESYLRDTARVLRPGGLALYHHSNYDAPDDRHYGLNPHARNRMTREMFCELAQAAGLEVVESRVIEWGGVPDLDCLTLVRKAEERRPDRAGGSAN